MNQVILYAKPGCHLCEQVKTDLDALRAEFPHELVEINIENDDNLLRVYFDKIPVVEIGPYILKAPITLIDLQVRLGAAADRERNHKVIDEKHPRHPKKQKYQTKSQLPGITRADEIAVWLSRRYFWILNLMVLLYVGLPLLAPVMMKIGWQAPARVIYGGYGFACHQLAYRSFFLFGDQAVYPRASAELAGFTTFGTATGISEDDTNASKFAARDYLGDEVVGYKTALCQRDIAIYAAILLFGVLFALSGQRIPALPWYLWVLVGMGPIGLDGMSQVMSQPPFELFSYRESIPLFRVLTGAVFGFTTAWFALPILEDTMREGLKYLDIKFERARQISQAAANRSEGS